MPNITWQEPQIVADLLAVTTGRSTLLITHDLDCLDQVDEIVVLDAGQVAERGTHSDLLHGGGQRTVYIGDGNLVFAHRPRPGPKVIVSG